MSLQGRVALITGGGRGIGRAIALGLAQDGADVAVNYKRDEASALETVAAIESIGRRARAYSASVESYDEDKAMVEAAVRDFGFVDILVNNAGIASKGNSVKNTDPAEMARVVATHAFGPHYLSQLVIPSMRTRPRGDIVMISSIATLQMAARGAPYNMGKAAMEALALTLAKEEKQHGIRVNIVAPGLVETEMGRRLAKATMGVQDLRQLDAAMPFGRVCQPEDVANTVRFLVSEAASYITGEKINVSGGGQS
jgi:3-oxoacyl-[acyl-carrier protein] reductase